MQLDEEFVDNISPEITIEDSGESDDGPIVPNAFAPIDFDISTRRIRDLHRDYTEHDLDPRPAFQRGYVWDKGRASRLIESVLLHVPLPLIYTAEEPDGKELVIDGQQHLTTFFGFIGGRFPKDESPFRLTGLKILSDFNGKLFRDLPEDVQRDFKKYNVSVIKISARSHLDVRFEIFERLNTGSISLSEQELRNCLYRGSLNELLKELARYEYFCKCLGITRPLPRMRDVEMVLRFVAFYDRSYLNYSGRMKSFLNKFMSDRKEIDNDRTREYRDAFRKAAEISYIVFGGNAFRRFTLGNRNHPTGKWEVSVNKALFDVIMWTFSRYEKRQILPIKDALRERLIDLMTTDNEFIKSITLATADLQKIQYRFRKWSDEVGTLVSIPSEERRLFSYRIKEKLFEADQNCHICRQRIETLDDSEVDHMEAFAVGGPTSVENARLAHRFCNRSRGAKRQRADA